jgi:hypothetical protein
MPPDVRNGYAFPDINLLIRGGCASDPAFEAVSLQNCDKPPKFARWEGGQSAACPRSSVASSTIQNAQYSVLMSLDTVFALALERGHAALCPPSQPANLLRARR